MSIQVHYYEQRDGVSVCKKCGTVENKDRIGPSWCSGRLPTVTVRQDDVARLERERDEAVRLLALANDGLAQLEAWRDALERERDEYRSAVNGVLAALYEATGDGQTYPLSALGERVRRELKLREKVR